MTDSARRDKRFASQQELLVRCETWSDFARLYAADVSRGGMFIVTAEPIPILAEIDVDMHLPEGHRVQLRASVVHVLDAAQAAREGRPSGVGVQFVALSALQKQQIIQLVEFASGEGDNPGVSYASRLFERSTSLPPSKVLDALPVDPGADSRRPSSRSSTRATAAASGTPPRSSARAGEPVASRPPSNSSPKLNASGRPKTGERPTVRPPDEGAAGAEPDVQVPAKPLDIEKLKFGVTHLAHRRFEQAVKTFSEIAAESPGDRQALQWLHTAHARVSLKNNDESGAVEHYQRVLDVDENNHEARKFVRDHYTKKRLNSLPFGRYFVKK